MLMRFARQRQHAVAGQPGAWGATTTSGRAARHRVLEIAHAKVAAVTKVDQREVDGEWVTRSAITTSEFGTRHAKRESRRPIASDRAVQGRVR